MDLTQKEEIIYFERLGFIFTQSEFCTRGTEQIYLDAFPRTYTNKNIFFDFNNIQEFEDKLKKIK